MKSYAVTIQMKPLQRYFHIVLFISYDFTKRNFIIIFFWGGGRGFFCFVTKRSEWVIAHTSLFYHSQFTNLVCRAGGCGSDPRGRTNTQGLKITEERRYGFFLQTAYP